MRVIIIGGVAAGMSAAAKLKRIKPDYQVVVYEKTDIVSFGACGLPYFVGGFFDDSNMMIARDKSKFIESGIDLKTFKVNQKPPKSFTILTVLFCIFSLIYFFIKLFELIGYS